MRGMSYDQNVSLQRQNAVAAYLKSKQLLGMFYFSWQKNTPARSTHRILDGGSIIMTL